MTDPASIRFNNPGAQWPAAESPDYGMDRVGVIGGNNKIAGFPTPELGAAANMDLLSRRYTGMTIGDAAKKWSNSGYSGVAGFDPKTVITPDLVRDPDFAIPFFKNLSKVEAGRPYPMSDEQWQKAHATFLAGGLKGDAAPVSTAPAAATPAAPVASQSAPFSLAPGDASAAPDAPAIDPATMQALQAISTRANQPTLPAPAPLTIQYPTPPGLARARALAAAMSHRPIGGA